MRPVAILGIGQTIIDEQWEKSIREIAAEAISHALQDAGRHLCRWGFRWQYDVGHH